MYGIIYLDLPMLVQPPISFMALPFLLSMGAADEFFCQFFRLWRYKILWFAGIMSGGKKKISSSRTTLVEVLLRMC